jgi:hypothetical protein
MTEPSVLEHNNPTVAGDADAAMLTFEVQRAGDPAQWVFTITQPATDVDVDPRYLATGPAAAAAIAAFCAQQLAGLGVLPQDVARMIYDRIPVPPSETP